MEGGDEHNAFIINGDPVSHDEVQWGWDGSPLSSDVLGRLVGWTGSESLIQGIIFDLDGTLADTLPVCFAAFRMTFEEFAPDEDWTDAKIAAMFGPSELGIIRRVIKDPNLWHEAHRSFLNHYADSHGICSGPFAGIVRVLDQLRERGVAIAIVTGKGAESAETSLVKLGLAARFSTVVAGSVDGIVKPQAIRSVVEDWALPADSVAYLGDAPSDVENAREAGVIALSAVWSPGSDPDACAAMNPDALFRTVEEFEGWIEANVVGCSQTQAEL